MNAIRAIGLGEAGHGSAHRRAAPLWRKALAASVRRGRRSTAGHRVGAIKRPYGPLFGKAAVFLTEASLPAAGRGRSPWGHRFRFREASSLRCESRQISRGALRLGGEIGGPTRCPRVVMVRRAREGGAKRSSGPPPRSAKDANGAAPMSQSAKGPCCRGCGMPMPAGCLPAMRLIRRR